ncbi:hypothetical protein FA13DRAFT_1726953 [Coprinellus micaceus]|uniref:Uncharacterized protein n=1 Tax=Coprinellus micaceus TaxID=71717 RepID=A0A4Y7TRR0_COPMI|nr:hypothetical protein FA13DRAFT_1726953 [Coprinellus micaceus]
MIATRRLAVRMILRLEPVKSPHDHARGTCADELAADGDDEPIEGRSSGRAMMDVEGEG